MFEMIIIFILLIFIYFASVTDEMKKKKIINNINFFPLTKEEQKEYRRYGDLEILKSFLLFMFVSGIFFAFYLIIKNYFTTNIIFKLFSLIAYIMFGLLCFLPYIVLFYRRPVGIVYGKISKKKGVHILGTLGSSYVYNIRIEKTNKVFSNVDLHFQNPLDISENDECKIVKSYLGFPYIFIDTKRNIEVDKDFIARAKVGGNIFFALAIIITIVLYFVIFILLLSKEYFAIVYPFVLWLISAVPFFTLSYSLKHKPETWRHIKKKNSKD